MRYCPTCRASFQSLRSCPRDKTATRADLADPLLGHVLAQRYRVLDRIAAGGMGQVYRAAHTRIATLFAIKVLYGDIAHDTTMRARFQREAEAASCLQSRHIVRVVDFDASPEDLLYIAMEHLDGQSLSDAVAKDGTFTPERAAKVGTQIARGLLHAHERGIVHRDLKPANVMLVTEDDEDDVVRLLDFGIAHLQQQEGLTQAGMLLGTPQYMSPEQFTGAPVDARSDLYALGIILYELLTGEVPFDAGNIVTFAHMHVKEAPRPVAERSSLISSDLESIVMKLLAKKPDDRFQSSRALIQALRSIDLRARVSRAPAAPPSTASIPLPLIGFSAVERIHRAIEVGAPAYNAGDHVACYQGYRQAAEDLLREGLRPDTRLAAGSRLEVALARAGRSESPTTAAWELRYAFDDLLNAESLRPSATAAATELNAAALVAAPRYASGELDLVGEYYVAFARWLLHAIKESNGDANVVSALSNALTAAAKSPPPARNALASIGQTLDALRQGLRATNPELPAVTGRLAQICPRAVEVGERIMHAIALGAPEYNTGNVEGCYRIYKNAAEEIIRDLGSTGPCAEITAVLQAGVTSSERATPSQGAWILRHAFDSLLAEIRAPSTLS